MTNKENYFYSLTENMLKNKGQYVVFGDISYTFPEFSVWCEICNKLFLDKNGQEDYKNVSIVNIEDIQYGSLKVTVAGTCDGDGRYYNEKSGRYLPVDAGLLGFVSLEQALKTLPEEDFKWYLDNKCLEIVKVSSVDNVSLTLEVDKYWKTCLKDKQEDIAVVYTQAEEDEECDEYEDEEE